jgi:NADH-quinone oxidoreductase subunit J
MIPRSLLVIGATLTLIGLAVALPLALVFFNAIRWGDDVLVFVLAEVMLGAGLLVVTMRDIIRCGLAMIVCFLALAALYVTMGAPLVGAAQVLVYIGAISVLILFAIMLTQTKDAPASLVFQTQAVGAAVAAVVLALIVAITVGATDWPAVGERIHTATGGVDGLARLLFTEYVLPFEVVSVLLLAAVIGGVFLAKREDEGPL